MPCGAQKGPRVNKILPGRRSWVVCSGKLGWDGSAQSYSPKISPVKAPQGPHSKEQLGSHAGTHSRHC